MTVRSAEIIGQFSKTTTGTKIPSVKTVNPQQQQQQNSKDKHLHMASLLDRTNMAVFKKNPIKLGIFRKQFLPIYPLFSPATVIHCLSVDFLSLDKKKTMKDWAFTTESSEMDIRKQRRKPSQQPVTVKSVAPSTVHANDWPTSPAKTAVKTKLRTMIYQNWLTNEVRRQIFLS